MSQLVFRDRSELRRWLEANHATSPGIWMVFGKDARVVTVRADEALEEALCFGWIDGQIKSINDSTYVKRFTPRRKGSKWSARNRKIAAELIARGLMTEHGLATIERAKAEGTWDVPGPSPVTEDQIAVLVEALHGAEPASTNYSKMSPSVRRTYAAFYLDAKSADARARRLERIIDRLNQNLKPM
ncbi:MAG: YdeI/OmpD-associated family protein [Bacillota bacterium]